MNNNNAQAHKRACLKLVLCLLAVWFSVSFLAGILFRDQLDKFSIGHAKLGFWMAQQGSIICFVFILIAYAFFMGKIDRKYGFEEDHSSPQSDQNAPEAPAEESTIEEQN